MTSLTRQLEQPALSQAADRAFDLVRWRFDGQRWADQFELLGGNAGIALGAASAGDLDLAILAVTPYLTTAEPTEGGVHWEVRAGGSTTSRTARSASSAHSPRSAGRLAATT